MNNEGTVRRWQFRAAAALPFLRLPSERMRRIADEKIADLGTDGFDVFYREESARPIAEADYQHMILHCLFSHMALLSGTSRGIRDLACDMAAEYLRAELFAPAGADGIKRLVTDPLPEGCDPHSASAIARGLMELREDETEELALMFRRDDHRYWYEKPEGTFQERKRRRFEAFKRKNKKLSEEEVWRNFLAEQIPEEWSAAAEGIGGSSGSALTYGLECGSREEKYLLRKIGKYDFSRYLKRFASQREEMVSDPGSFDYIPYYYGLKNYGNLPFIEPLEYSESSKVEELVIAIDTSGSCRRDTLERFLAEIEKILMNRENFFRKMNIHIFQCDAIIQEHAVIRSIEEWQEYRKDLTIRGRGGTDFTPVFREVERIRKDGGLKKLRGLLYFTDGDGVYPREEPPYETAFVFTNAKALEYTIPEWIVKLCLDVPSYQQYWKGTGL